MASTGKKDVLQKIVECMEISDEELVFDDACSAPTVKSPSSKPKESENVKEDMEIFDDNVSTKNNTKKEVPEMDKSNEEETIENIQSLLNTKEFGKTENVKPELHEEKYVCVVPVNSEAKNGSVVERKSEDTTKSKNPLEIPQVMLDQLDLKKFPNLKINDSAESVNSEVEKKIEKPQTNSNLIQEIQKRMENRKGQQKMKTPDVEAVVVKRKRGRPRKDGSTPTSIAAETPEPIVTTPIIRPKNLEELKATPKLPLIKKTPMQPTSQKKEKISSEEIETDDEVVEMSMPTRPRSSRKIKLTDKFKTFVAQEKSIKYILSEEENKPIEKKISASKLVEKKSIDQNKNQAGTSTPRIKPRSDIQIQLKRKKGEKSEEVEEIDLDEEEEEYSANEDQAGRSVQKKKKVEIAVKGTSNAVKKIPKALVKKKIMISESDLSDGYDTVDDEDMDPDFQDSDIGSDVTISDVEDDTDIILDETPSRTVMELVRDVFHMMPTWNLHILPNTKTFCLAQIIRGVNGIPMLKKCIEIDLDFRVKVFVHQIHYKKYDGIYDSEDHLIQLLQLVDAM